MRLFLFISFLFFNKLLSTEKINLNSDWKFLFKENFYTAAVPGTVHTDLLNNNLIPDPIIGANEKKLIWIDTTTWTYKKYFDVDSSILKKQFIEIVFDGLDTYADVYLNDSLILKSENMFRQWRVDIKNLIKISKNEIKIIFYPVLKINSVKSAKEKYKLPQDDRTYSRKAQFQFGWDFAPTLIGCGIWRDVNIEAWDNFKINSAYCFADSIIDKIAYLNLRVEINSVKKLNSIISVNSIAENDIIIDKSSEIDSGIINYDFKIELKDPKLWWINGLGKQNLYDWNIKIVNVEEFEEKKIRFGIRKIELVQEKDSIGESFYFKINGTPIFVKGANYVPPDIFLPRVKKSDYEKIISSVIKSNMNMLRVWGGGVYPSEDFYNLCDEKGILVWQDFMFANSMMPSGNEFYENVKQEAIENIKNIRIHPSLSLWCGNNEIEEGWFNWGWQKQFGYKEGDVEKIWNDYKNIFHNLIPNLIKENNPEINYISSSPKIGWGNKESLYSGDMHFWGVWWGKVPFEEYEKNIPRFMSEYGFQSAPSLKTMNKFVKEEKFKFSSPEIKNHQKHPTGFKIIESYLKKYFPMPRTLSEYALVTQHLQSFGLTKAIESHRREMPKCMGTLFWQLNEPWPGFTWSAIDYYGEEKILFKTVSELYKPILISVKENKTDVNFFVVSDLNIDTNATIEIILYDLKRKFLKRISKQIFIEKNKSKIYLTKTKKYIVDGLNLKDIFLEIKVKNSKQELMALKKFYFVKPKDLNLTADEFWKFLKFNF